MKLVWSLSCLIFAAALSYVRANDRVACYYATWSHGFRGEGKFLHSDIDPNLCTHISYYSVGVDQTNGRITLLDPSFDLDNKGLANFAALKNKNPKLTTLVALDAINAAYENMKVILPNVELRKSFVTNAVGFLTEFKLDGLDVVWEGITPQEKANMVLLVEELKTAFKPKGLVLALTVTSPQEAIDKSYEVGSLNSHVDYFNVLTLDYHSASDKVSGANAPLRPQPSDPKDTTLTVSASIEAWLKSGATPSKLNLAIGTYGHTFELKDAADNDTGSPVTGAGPVGPYNQDNYTWTYLEICADQKANKNAWKVVNQDNNYVYAVKEKLWIGYEDVESSKAKGAYAREKGLGGIVIWNLHGDDFKGSCGAKWPITTAATQGLKG